MQTPGVQPPSSLRHQHPQCSLLCSLQLAAKRQRREERRSQSVREGPALNRTVRWSQRGRGHKWWDRGNEKADGTRGSPPWRGKPRERAPCAGLHARADLCYLHRSPPGGASAVRLALDADRGNRAGIRRGLEGLGDAKQSLVVTGLGRRGRCGEKTPEWLPG